LKLSRLVVPVIAGAIVGIIATTTVNKLFNARRNRALTSESSQTPQETHENYLRKFAQEKISQPWANQAEGAIAMWFSNRLEHRHEIAIKAIHCRSEICVVDLQWSSREFALRDYKDLLAINSESLLGCSSEIFLPISASSPYAAQLILTGCQIGANVAQRAPDHVHDAGLDDGHRPPKSP